MEDISFVWNVVSKPISSCDCIIGHFLSIKGVRELAGSGVAVREGRTPKVPVAHKCPKIWYNIIVYVNGATRSATEIGRLVHDLLCPDAAKMYFDLLKKRVSQFKNSEEGRYAMCKAMEKIEARGERKNMLATAKRMLKSGMLALKDIAKFSGLSLAEVKKLQASMA